MNILQKFLLTAFLFAFFPISATSSERHESINANNPENRHTEISQRQAITIAQQHIKGRVLDIRRNENVYRVKILSDQGSIHIIQVSVSDGTIKSGH
ncbi:PepSY domain-containing protein [Nitrosomonas marina]|uniref:Peptidase propeptide and YPEB domain-containing protein n=1 Tax=Nitrosomonas marina TaxID=917 RepID=A0A1H8CRL0_9PROT|nr:PepSY domain-containing protein [Nitrosomonas marina]SEM96767.1 hypothetical protein SAMN05216325_10568 [Nitrosomonas marina]